VIVTFEESQLPRATDELGPGDGAVVSIGVFDGVHLGHKAILAGNVARARALGAIPTIVTFRRHPKQLLLGRAPRTLTTLGHRLELFQRAGIGHAVALTFDEGLRDLSAADFVRRICVDGLGARAFVLGFDSKFGRDREGTPELLASLGHDVEVVPKVVLQGRAVSSTAIREAVELGDLAGAAAMLGRPVAILGKVVHGAELGRELGFPTANLDLSHEHHPPPGVYACRVRRTDQGGESLAGVTNIGFRPTLDGPAPVDPVVEVHLLDFEGDLYGERLELEFLERLRGEQRFDGLEALRDQIAADVARAREVLAAGRTG
jgi:riboflavin kinase/FMN adenylyltransferase